jgi:hypothetical protein
MEYQAGMRSSETKGNISNNNMKSNTNQLITKQSLQRNLPKENNIGNN